LLLTEKQALKCLKIEREGFAGEISSLSLNMNSKFTLLMPWFYLW